MVNVIYKCRKISFKHLVERRTLIFDQRILLNNSFSVCAKSVCIKQHVIYPKSSEDRLTSLRYGKNDIINIFHEF